MVASLLGTSSWFCLSRAVSFSCVTLLHVCVTFTHLSDLPDIFLSSPRFTSLHGTALPLKVCVYVQTQIYTLCILVRVCVQVLLDLASLIFEEQQCLEVLLRKIAGTILSFMQAHACTVFIADEDSMVSTHTHAHILKCLVKQILLSK